MGEARYPVRVFSAVFLLSGLIGGAQAGFEAQSPSDHPPEIKRSLEIRARYNVVTVDSEPAIYVDSVSVHHLREEESSIASRDADGHWHVSAVIEEGPGLLKVVPHLISQDAWRLSETDGRHLDELLGQADLYRESPEGPVNEGVGAVLHTMEIDSPTRHTVIRWSGRLREKAGAVADLVLGSD